jgi:hypothetical protein
LRDIRARTAGDGFSSLGAGSKAGYRSRMDQIRRDHGHRAVAGLTKQRIEEKDLKPLHNLPGAKLDTLKKLRILINHAKDLKRLSADPSDGIKRGKSNEIRSWTDAEMTAFEKNRSGSLAERNRKPVAQIALPFAIHRNINGEDQHTVTHVFGPADKLLR